MIEETLVWNNQPRRDESINNLLIYFTSLSSNLIAWSFVSVESLRRGCRVEGGKERQVFVVVVVVGVAPLVRARRLCVCFYFVCLPGGVLGWALFDSFCSVFTAATLPPLAHNSKAKQTHTHTYRGRGGAGGEGKSNPSTNYQKEKNLISNINARRSTLCAIVLLSFQKLVF